MKVLIVEDSQFIFNIIEKILNSDPSIEIVGNAIDGYEAIEMTKKLKPDVISMDLVLPRLNGVEAIKTIMNQCPTPILVLSHLVNTNQSESVFKALEFGALEAIDKKLFDKGALSIESVKNFIDTLKVLSKIKVITRRYYTNQQIENFKVSSKIRSVEDSIIGIVASTGGPQAIQQILLALNQDIKPPILIVQHIANGFSQGFADWLQSFTSLKVQLAKDNEFLQEGHVYIAPTSVHMKVKNKRFLTVGGNIPVDSNCPSGTVLFESISLVYKENSMGVLLTGMGRDGAQGLLNIKNAGGYTLIQDEKTAVIYGMPLAAKNLGAVKEEVSLNEVSKKIFDWCNYKL